MCEDSKKVYMLIRFGVSSVLECRNSLNRNHSILKTHNGRVIGFGEEIELLEVGRGGWLGNQAVVLLEFTSEKDARFWFEGGPDIKQPDWLHGVDVVILPVRDITPTDKHAVMLVDASIRDPAAFDGYAHEVKEKLRAHGASPAIVGTKNAHKLRGLWNPLYTVAHFFPTQDKIKEIFSSADLLDIEDRRRMLAECDVVCFTLKPL